MVTPFDFGSFSRDSVAFLGPSGSRMTYGQLSDAVEAVIERFSRHSSAKSLVMCVGDRDVTVITGYLAAVQAGHAVALLSPVSTDEFQGFVDSYSPEFIVFGSESRLEPPRGYINISAAGVQMFVAESRESCTIFPDTALLLKTSGTMGSPKMVRLSLSGLTHNVRSVATHLNLTSADVGVTSMPIHHGYGLSILNTHLHVGAPVLLTSRSPLSAKFWSECDTAACTNFGAVPSIFVLLRRAGFELGGRRSLKCLTTSGGAMAREDRMFYYSQMKSIDGRFAPMYGQTEATARMAVLPWADLPEHIESAGRPLHGTRISIADANSDGNGVVIFEGPNVMLGYAESRADLRLGDACGGVLDTGDIGRLCDGCLYLAGRRKRIVKILGQRVELDEIERLLGGVVAAVTRGGEERIYVVSTADVVVVRERVLMALRGLVIPPSAVSVVRVDAIPLTAVGKVDYGAVERDLLP